MILFDITIAFDKKVRDLINKHCTGEGVNPREIYQFVKTHERKKIVLDNLCNEVRNYEMKFGNRAGRAGRDKIIEAVAMMFIDQTIKQREEQLKSSAEKQRIKDEARPDIEKAQEALGAQVTEVDSTIELN